MRSVILRQWTKRRMGVIWQDFGSTVRAKEFWICWRRDRITVITFGVKSKKISSHLRYRYLH